MLEPASAIRWRVPALSGCGRLKQPQRVFTGCTEQPYTRACSASDGERWNGRGPPVRIFASMSSVMLRYTALTISPA